MVDQTRINPSEDDGSSPISPLQFFVKPITVKDMTEFVEKHHYLPNA